MKRRNGVLRYGLGHDTICGVSLLVQYCGMVGIARNSVDRSLFPCLCVYTPKIMDGRTDRKSTEIHDNNKILDRDKDSDDDDHCCQSRHHRHHQRHRLTLTPTHTHTHINRVSEREKERAHRHTPLTQHTIATHTIATHTIDTTHTRARHPKNKKICENAKTDSLTDIRTDSDSNKKFSRAQHNTPSTQHTINTTHHQHNTPSTQHTIDTTHHRHNTPSTHTKGTVPHSIHNSGMCSVMTPSSSIGLICNLHDSWLWLPNSTSMQVPRLLSMVPFDCGFVASAILSSELHLQFNDSWDHSTASGTTILLDCSLCSVCLDSISVVVPVSIRGSLVLFTLGGLFKTLELVGATITSAPTRNTSGIGSTRLGTRVTHQSHCTIAMTISCKGGVKTGHLTAFGKCIRWSNEDGSDIHCV